MNFELLKSLGFSENSAKVITDFLGERVIYQPESATLKKPKETPQIPTNGEVRI
jgi:hypothetical protein